MEENKTYKAFPITEEIIKEICNEAFLQCKNAHRLYPDNNHTFNSFWDGNKEQLIKKYLPVEQPTYSSVSAEQQEARKEVEDILEGAEFITPRGNNWRLSAINQIMEVFSQLQTCKPSFPNDEEIEKYVHALKFKIRNCESSDNDVSWGMQEGILISKGDAKKIAEWLLSYKVKEGGKE